MLRMLIVIYSVNLIFSLRQTSILAEYYVTLEPEKRRVLLFQMILSISDLFTFNLIHPDWKEMLKMF